MKFIYLFCALIFSTPIFPEKSTFPRELLEENHFDLSSCQNNKKCIISFIPYLQVVCTPIPSGGYGGSLRAHKQYLGLQLDCNTCNVNFFGNNQYLQMSISGLYYPFYKDNNSWLSKCNITYGISRIYLTSKFKKESHFMLGPLSVGYQGKSLFFDIGISAIDIHSLSSSRDRKIGYCLYESVKIGYCF